MFIVFIEPPSATVQGDQIHRTQAPADALAATGDDVFVLTGTWLSPCVQQAARRADVVILCQAVDVDFVPLCEQRRREGLCTIVEINDHFCRPVTGNQAGRFFAQPAMQALLWQTAGLADGVQFSTPYLAEQYCTAHANRAVFANIAPLVLGRAARAQRPRQAGRGAILGWGGSLGHRADLARVLPTVHRVLQLHPACRFHVMAPPALAPLLAGLPAEQVHFFPSAPFADYMRFVARLDISLGPQQDTPFNRGRSDVKFLEAAACGVVFIGARLPAYTGTVRDGDTGLLYASDEELFCHLNSLIDEPQRRLQLGGAAYLYAQRERSAAADAQARLAWLRATCRATAAPAAAVAATKKAWRQKIQQECQHPIAHADGRALHAPMAAAERLLYAASMAPGDGDRLGDADALLLAARRARPGALLPRLLAASRCAGHASAGRRRRKIQAATGPDERAEAVGLDELITLSQEHPGSHAVALALVRAHARAGRGPAALRLARASLRGRAASCAALWVERAQLEGLYGDGRDALAAWRGALAVSPHLWTAAAAWFRQWLAAPHPADGSAGEEAVAVAERAAAASVHVPEPALLLARALRAAKQWQPCQHALRRAQALVPGHLAEATLNAELHALWAEAHAAQGDAAGARRHLARARRWLGRAPKELADRATLPAP